ncbi:MAG: YaaA family protein, partial [Lactobacillales bacterium]|nr:YaaA family protein [Lactobacillales bacterium]
MNIIISPSKEMTTTDSQQPAIRLYNGLQFRYLRENLTNEDFSFLNQQLHIISAEHGLLRPLDEIGA